MSSSKAEIPKRTRRLLLSRESLQRLAPSPADAASGPTESCAPPQTQQGPSCIFPAARPAALAPRRA